MTAVAIVGTGPMGIYVFRALCDQQPPLHVWLFEKGSKAGVGMPYSPETASKTMLANIASIEIPPICETYLDWLQAQPTARLRSYGLDAGDLDDRQFTPRLLLGEYFRDQLMTLIEAARSAGHVVELREATEVVDLRPTGSGLTLRTDAGDEAQVFDRVVLATGHVFPESEADTASYFPSPWSGLLDVEIPATRVGIMGTSLSAIDAAMAVAGQHGRFRRSKSGEELEFLTSSQDLKITLMSWTGILPEADFYCPLPYDDLDVMSEISMAEALQSNEPYDALFDLFRDELSRADPTYAGLIALHTLTADTFPDAYFRARAESDPFQWARENLEEVERNKSRKITVPWRYAILRMHELVELAIPQLREKDRARFDKGWRTVFTDNYAAVPSESIRRLLALRDAGVLKVLALGHDYDLQREAEQTLIVANGQTHVFEVFVDARGQKPLKVRDLPFPTLRDALLDEGAEVPEVDEGYTLIAPGGFRSRVKLGAIPYLMHDRPFVQGITACASVGEAIAQGIKGEICARRRRRLAA